MPSDARARSGSPRCSLKNPIESTCGATRTRVISTGAHLWTNHFDGSLEDILDLQDVAHSLSPIPPEQYPPKVAEDFELNYAGWLTRSLSAGRARGQRSTVESAAIGAKFLSSIMTPLRQGGDLTTVVAPASTAR